jgi:translation elongation factor EF-G
MMMHANNREDVKAAYTGDIVAVGGLKDVTTGVCSCMCVLVSCSYKSVNVCVFACVEFERHGKVAALFVVQC